MRRRVGVRDWERLPVVVCPHSYYDPRDLVEPYYNTRWKALVLFDTIATLIVHTTIHSTRFVAGDELLLDLICACNIIHFARIIIPQVPLASATPPPRSAPPRAAPIKR